MDVDEVRTSFAVSRGWTLFWSWRFESKSGLSWRASYCGPSLSLEHSPCPPRSLVYERQSVWGGSVHTRHVSPWQGFDLRGQCPCVDSERVTFPSIRVLVITWDEVWLRCGDHLKAEITLSPEAGTTILQNTSKFAVHLGVVPQSHPALLI